MSTSFRQSVNDKISLAVNHLLQQSPENQIALKQLKGTKVQIYIDGPNQSILVFFHAHSIEIRLFEDETCDLMISGTPFVLMQCLSKANQSELPEGLTIDGNVQLAQKLLTIFNRLEIDWEELLASYIGDIAAHQLGQFGRGILVSAQQTSDTFRQNLTEYLQEEIQWLPTRIEINEYLNQVDNLRTGVDRLSARLNVINKKLSK